MTPRDLRRVLEATWPAAATRRLGPWMLRDGQGGGRRVSAATAAGPWRAGDIARAEAAQQAMGQRPLFMVREGEQALDAALAAAGYRVIDPVTAWATDCAALARTAPDPMTGFAHWPPLAITADLWSACGIGAARLAVMERVVGPKAVVLGRLNDRPSGVAFVALHGQTAMLHALEVLPAMRRQGSANNILRHAAIWAQDNAAKRFSLVATTANTAAADLYASLKMRPVGQYHYREK